MTEPAESPVVTAVDSMRPAIYHVDAAGKLRRDLSVAELAAVIKNGTGQLWVDMMVSSRQCVAMLDNVFAFHPLAVEDALNPVSRVKVDEYPGFLFAIMRGVRFKRETDDPYDTETFNISFFLGPNYLVTVHGGQSPAFTTVAERVQRHPELLQRGAEIVMHGIMDAAVDAYFPLLDQIEEFVDGLEERVFRHFDRTALQDIFEVKRLVLSLRRHLGPQREVFNILANRPTPLLAPEVQVYFRDIYDHNLRINDSLETYRELLSSTLDSYLTQVSNNLGEITKALSVVATISIPFVVVSGMWGMNFAHIPWSDAPHAFWYMLALQLGGSAFLLAILRWRKLI
ncbi:MAG TPA: magnesium transporter CorA family protein [Gemmatimonadaceae bacterium]|nr:magnesium transporter CorA family protein [Gemmatimonadaceae bacterium]